MNHTEEVREQELEEWYAARGRKAPDSPDHHRSMIEYSRDRIAFHKLQRAHYETWKDSDDKVLWLATYDKIIADHTAEIARHELALMGTAQLAAE